MDDDISEEYSEEEFVEELPEEPENIWWVIARFLIGLLIIIGLIYVSGIYQFTFFQKTSPEISQEELPAVVDGPALTIPVQVYVLESQRDDSSFSQANTIQSLVENANNIWNQAQVTFAIQDISRVQVDEDMIVAAQANPHMLTDQLPQYTTDTVTIILTRSLGGINGVAYGGSNILSVAEYTSSLTFRVLAHELGHILSLDHTSDKRDLMYSGSGGTRLSIEEAREARDAARRFFE